MNRPLRSIQFYFSKLGFCFTALAFTAVYFHHPYFGIVFALIAGSRLQFNTERYEESEREKMDDFIRKAAVLAAKGTSRRWPCL
jgi:hypothetical protein